MARQPADAVGAVMAHIDGAYRRVLQAGRARPPRLWLTLMLNCQRCHGTVWPESLLQVLLGTAEFDPAAMCSADSIQSVSPAPVHFASHPRNSGPVPGLRGTAGMAELNRLYNEQLADKN